jgi:hypothetical protein
VSLDSLGTIAAAQREFSRQAAQARADALLESFDAGTQDGKSARARLLRRACRPASAWLDTPVFFASLCFHSLDSAPELPWAPPPDQHVTGVGFPMASRAPKLVVRPRYLEPFM